MWDIWLKCGFICRHLWLWFRQSISKLVRSHIILCQHCNPCDEKEGRARYNLLSFTVEIINVFSNDNLMDVGFAQTIFPFLMILKIICLQGRNYYYLSIIINYFLFLDLFFLLATFYLFRYFANIFNIFRIYERLDKSSIQFYIFIKLAQDYEAK